jgi:hypothetical protein
MDTTTLVVGLCTFVLGQLFALKLADRQADHQLKRDREAREEARRDQSRELQRESLLALQDALEIYGGAVAETHSACRQRTDAEGVWTVDVDAVKGEQKAALGVSKLVNRIKDEPLPPLWNAANNHVWDVLHSKSPKDGDVAYVNWLERWQQLHSRLRIVLQEHI